MAQLYSGLSDDRQLRLCDTDTRCISARLAAAGVRYEHVDIEPQAFDSLAQADEIITAYLEPLDRLVGSQPGLSMQVTRIDHDHPRLATVKRRLMTEHAHEVDEAQLLVGGRGVLYMRSGSVVHALYCTPGDYVRLPSGLGHWFGMDPASGFCTIRMFGEAAGSAQRWRGENMADRFELV